MKKFIFILGRKPLISLAELISFLPKPTNYLKLSGRLLLIETNAFPATEALNKLGGSVKILEVISEETSAKNCETQGLNKLIEHFKGQTVKAKYAFAVHGIPNGDYKILKNLLKNSKIQLQKEGINGRYLNKTLKNCDTAQILTEKILEKGIELNVVKIFNQFFIAKTVAIQDINEYSKRDYDRPARNSKKGMLPPKLAQILINLSECKQAIYDPFCGSGTVLAEALNSGLKAIGSDLNPESVAETKENLYWSARQNPSFNGKYEVFKANAKSFNSDQLSFEIDGVASETYLGPPISHIPSPKDQKDTFKQLEETIAGFFQNAKNNLPKGTIIAITLLAYRENDNFIIQKNLHNKIKQIGIKLIPLIPEEIKQQLEISAKHTDTLIYERPEQIVCREICKFQI